MKQYRQQIDRLKSERQRIHDSIICEEANLRAKKKSLNNSHNALALFQEVSKDIQERAHIRIASIVTKALKAVGSKYSFKLAFESKRGQTEAKPILVHAGEEYDPGFCVGNGVEDIVAFALRLAAISMTRPKPRKALIVDEPFKSLSKRFHSKTGQLLETLSKELDIQIIIVTHKDEIARQIENYGTVVRL